MRTVILSIKLSQEESQALVNYVAGRLIAYEDRKCELQIDGKVIISQPKVEGGNLDTNVNTDGLHTGYTLDNLGLGKKKGDGIDKGKR